MDFRYGSKVSVGGRVLGLSLAVLAPVFWAQSADYNYDEAKVPQYELPDPLLLKNGERVSSETVWVEQRRPEVLRLFEKEMYGRSPKKPKRMQFELVDLEAEALSGLAIRKQVVIRLKGSSEAPSMNLLIYLPSNAPKPVPAFLALNFQGNHSIHPDPAIFLSDRWMREGGEGVVNHRATEDSRGAAAPRWPVEMILARGYAVATVYYGDLEPDHAEGWHEGIRSEFGPKPKEGSLPKAAWGAIGAWAWGLSRALDYLETDPDIDAERVAVMGHSRLGKTAVWAGAQDDRFAMVISNDSGCGGAALSRRRFGETVKRINTSFPHWFNGNFKKYNEAEDTLPLDQHMLLALVAPRSLYVASAAEDQWADPRGEFLSALSAGPVYRLFGLDGLGVDEMPEIEQAVGERIGYHIRSGKHNVTDYDWEQYLRFADRQFGESD